MFHPLRQTNYYLFSQNYVNYTINRKKFLSIQTVKLNKTYQRKYCLREKWTSELLDNTN